MTFLDDIETDNTIFFDPVSGFAETIIYNGVDIFAVEDGGGFSDTGGPGVISESLTMYIKAEDVEKPKQGDVVVYRSNNYHVSGYPAYDGGVWMITITAETNNAIGIMS